MSREKELRQLVKDAGVRLVRTGLVQGTWGNISVRLDGKRMIVTPSGLDYDRLTPEDMVIVNIETMEYEGKLKPTSEKKVHAAIYRERPEINAVIHSHPINCSVISAARVELPVMSDEMLKYVKGSAKIGSYGLPSTNKLNEGTLKALVGRNACIMANHGVVACGETLEDAFETCRVMEESSKAFIAQEAVKKMGASQYSPDLCEKYFYKIKGVKI